MLEEVADGEVDGIGAEVWEGEVDSLHKVKGAMDFQQEHPATVENCPEGHPQDRQNHQAHYVPNHHHKTSLLLELVELVGEDIPGVGPLELAVEDLWVPFVGEGLDEIVLEGLHQEYEDVEADREDGRLAEGAVEWYMGSIELLEQEEYAVEDTDAEEVADQGYFYHDLVGYHISKVVSDGPDVRKQTKYVPPLHDRGAVQPPADLELVFLVPDLLEILVEGHHVDVEVFVKMVDFEGLFQHQVAQFGSFHGVEELEVAVGSAVVGGVFEGKPQLLEETTFEGFAGEFELLVEDGFIMNFILVFSADIFLELEVQSPPGYVGEEFLTARVHLSSVVLEDVFLFLHWDGILDLGFEEIEDCIRLLPVASEQLVLCKA